MRKNPIEKSILQDKLRQIPGMILTFLWFVFFPLWQGGSYSHITEDKWKCMLVLTALTVLITIIDIVYDTIYRTENETEISFKPSVPQVLAASYFMWVCLSAFLGAYHEQINAEGQRVVLFGARRYEGLITQLCYCAVFFCLSIRKISIRAASYLASFGVLSYFAIVLLQYEGHNPFGLFPDGLSAKTNPSFQGTIGNIDVVSGYIVLITSFIWGTFVAMKKGGWLCYIGGLAGVLLAIFMDVQSGMIAFLVGGILLLAWMLTDENVRFHGWLVYFGVAFCLFIRSFLSLPSENESGVLVFTGITRNHLLFLSVLFLLCSVTALRFYHRGKSISKKKTVLLLIVLIAIVVTVFYFVPLKQQHGGIWELQQTLKGKPQDYFGSWRIGVWRITLDLIRKYPVFGTGPDTFYYAFNPVWKEYETYLQTEKGFTSVLQTFDTPHNEYLAIMSNNGIPALILYLCLMGSILLCRGKKVEKKEEIGGLILSVLLFMVQGFFSFSICLVTPMFWAIAGITAEKE